MNLSGKFIKSIVLPIFGLLGIMGMTSTLDYKQTECIYSPENRYIWIKLNNAISEKGFRYVSDGVIFDSPFPGMSTTLNYEDVISMVFSEKENEFGGLMISWKEKNGSIETENFGFINIKCWKNLKEISRTNPLSNHIKLVDNKREN